MSCGAQLGSCHPGSGPSSFWVPVTSYLCCAGAVRAPRAVSCASCLPPLHPGRPQGHPLLAPQSLAATVSVAPPHLAVNSLSGCGGAKHSISQGRKLRQGVVSYYVQGHRQREREAWVLAEAVWPGAQEFFRAVLSHLPQVSGASISSLSHQGGAVSSQLLK